MNGYLILFLLYSSFPGFAAFPGISIFCNKYTGFILGAMKIASNGRIYCVLKIRVQVFNNFTQKKFCEPLNIKLVSKPKIQPNEIFRRPQNYFW